jgi:hypothetical protein
MTLITLTVLVTTNNLVALTILKTLLTLISLTKPLGGHRGITVQAALSYQRSFGVKVRLERKKSAGYFR